MQPPVEDYLPAATPIFGGSDLQQAGRCQRPRGLRDHLLMYTSSGHCRIRFPGGELVTEAGDMVLIAPWSPQDYGPDPGRGPWGVIWAVFQAQPAWLDYLAWPEASPGIARLPLDDLQIRRQAVARLDEAQALSMGGLPNRAALAMNALEAALLWCWNQWRGATRLDPRIKRAVAWMCGHLAEPIDLSRAAHEAGLSLPHFARLFRRHVGTTPQRFLEERRIERACALLRATALPVKEVAERTGFASAFYFSSRFRRRMKRSPRDYRRISDGAPG